MRLRIVLPVLVTLAAAATVAVAVPASLAAPAAAPVCTYTPKLPARVVISKPSVVLHTPVVITGGQQCKADFSASEDLTHSSDRYELSWQYNSTTSTNTILPITVIPGIYRTQKSTAMCGVTAPGGGSLTCQVEPGSTVIKFGQKAHFSAGRLSGLKHDKVRFTAKATRYDQSETKYVTTKIAIQRQRHNGTWKTIHTAVAKGKKGYVWTHTERKTARYRAVSSPTATSFSAASRSIKV